MSNSQYVKFPSRQAGPFTSNQNLIDFEMPDNNGVYDLTKSFINIMCSVETPNNAGICNVVPKFGKSKYAFNNVALVRNATMTARKAGKIEDLREIGLYRNTLSAIRKGKSNKESIEYGSLLNFYDKNGFKSSQARILNYIGSDESYNVEFPIQFPLSEIFETGRLSEYHISKWGQTRIHLEAYLEKLKFEHLNLAMPCYEITGNKKQLRTSDPEAINDKIPKYYKDLIGRDLMVYDVADDKIIQSKLTNVTRETSVAYLNTLIFTFANDVNRDTGSLDSYIILNSNNYNKGTLGNTRTDITLDLSPDELESSGFWVSQKITVFKNQQKSSQYKEKVITSLDYDNNGNLVLTLDSELDATNFADADDVFIFPAQIKPDNETANFSDKVSVSFPSAEITLKVVTNPGPAPERLQYMSITTEQFTSGNAIENFERMFQLEPNAMNFYVMFPDADYLYSQNDPGVNSIRFRLDNKDLTDRNYDVHKLLYNDRLNMLMMNSGYAVKSLKGTIYNNENVINSQMNTDKVTVLGNPCPLTQNEKLLQVNLGCSTGISKINLYKQVLKSI